MFRYRKSLKNISYDEQGYIYFKCRMFKKLTQREKEKLLTLCFIAGGDDWKAVYDYLFAGHSEAKVCMEHCISKATLQRMVNRFYQRFKSPDNMKP